MPEDQHAKCDDPLAGIWGISIRPTEIRLTALFSLWGIDPLRVLLNDT